MIKVIFDAIVNGAKYDIEHLLKQQLKEGAKPEECLKAIVAGVEETERRFEEGGNFLPELAVAAETFKIGANLLKPLLTEHFNQEAGLVILGTAYGDIHDVGKNLFGFLLESGGFKVIDLGSDVSPERFIKAAKENPADVIAISALMTPAMFGMRDVIRLLEKEKLRNKVKVIIGGVAVSKKFAEEIGADAYAPTAPQGVDLVKSWFASNVNLKQTNIN